MFVFTAEEKTVLADLRNWVKQTMISHKFTGKCNKEWEDINRGESIMDQKIVDAFHIQYEENRVYDRMNWMGIPIRTLAQDLFIIQDLIWKTKPRTIIETGTCFGGSTLFYASLLELIDERRVDEERLVITIDKEDRWRPEADIPFRILARIRRIISDSIEPSMVKQMWQKFHDDPCMVILDSWHTKEHVAKELELYSPFVTVGSYLIVEDTHVSGHPVPWKWGEGPHEAVMEFLAKNDNFVIDKECERLELTYHPDGYLRRIK